MTMPAYDVIAWMLLLSVAGLVIIAAAAAFLRIMDKWRGPETMPPAERRPEPELYAGCPTCEGARAVSVHSLIRHQNRDHTGGIRW